MGFCYCSMPDCFVTLPCCALDLSAVCNCGIFIYIYLHFLQLLMYESVVNLTYHTVTSMMTSHGSS